MRVALDTNRLTDLFQGDAALAKWPRTGDDSAGRTTVGGSRQAPA